MVFTSYLAIVLPVLLLALPSESSDIDLGAVEVLERQLREVSVAPTQAVMLHVSAGNLYKENGRYELAEQHYKSARGLAARTGDGEQLVSVLASLGTLRFRQGRLREARQELEKAHALAAGQAQAPIAQTLGNVHRELGQYGEALRLYQEAQRLGLSTGLLNSDMGDTYARSGDLNQALDLLQSGVKMLKANTQASGADDVDLAAANSVLGSVHHMRGDLARAEEAYRKAWKTQTRVLRPGHPDLVATQLRRARLQRDLGDLVQAQAAVDKLEATLRESPRESPELRAVLILKADFLREQANYKEAESALEGSLATHAHCCKDEGHPEVAIALHIYGSVLHDQHLYSLAVKKYEQALHMLVQTLGSANPETGAVHNSLGTLYQDTGNAEAAQQQFTKCLEIQLQTVGAKSPEVSNTYNNLATILSRKGESAEAAMLLTKALDILDMAGVSMSNPERKVYTENLAMLNSQPLAV